MLLHKFVDVLGQSKTLFLFNNSLNILLDRAMCKFDTTHCIACASKIYYQPTIEKLSNPIWYYNRTPVRFLKCWFLASCGSHLRYKLRGRLLMCNLLTTKNGFKWSYATFIRVGDEHVQQVSHRALLKEFDIRQSMNRKGHCWDNAVSESFFHIAPQRDILVGIHSI